MGDTGGADEEKKKKERGPNDAKVLAEGFIECPEKMDPYEQFAKNIKAFRQFQPEDKKRRLKHLSEDLAFRGRRSIRKMRRFIAAERSAMMEEQKKLMKARDAMDAARHETYPSLPDFDCFQYFDVLATFHQNAAAMLSEHLSRLGVGSPMAAAAALST
uniref:BAR domain-containing protein n=1 Tax=Parascaris equorum TaxID=6256 RepID=A0A914S555_PAREQ